MALLTVIERYNEEFEGIFSVLRVLYLYNFSSVLYIHGFHAGSGYGNEASDSFA